MIDPRLHVLRVLAEVGTLTEAAHRLGYTPSAISHQLRGLSKDLGVRVVEPRGRGLVLTRAGQLLLERSQELFTGGGDPGELDGSLGPIHADGCTYAAPLPQPRCFHRRPW